MNSQIALYLKPIINAISCIAQDASPLTHVSLTKVFRLITVFMSGKNTDSQIPLHSVEPHYIKAISSIARDASPLTHASIAKLFRLITVFSV